jgi:hypothetical protein
MGSVHDQIVWDLNPSLKWDQLFLILSQQWIKGNLQIEAGLFTNPLISESDLPSEDYDYNTEIINKITKFEGLDRWSSKFTQCKLTGYKLFLMKYHRKKCEVNEIKNDFRK